MKSKATGGSAKAKTASDKPVVPDATSGTTSGSTATSGSASGSTASKGADTTDGAAAGGSDSDGSPRRRTSRRSSVARLHSRSRGDARSRVEEASSLWKTYKETGDQKTRNALVECYVHIVRFVAERIFSKLPSSVDFDDLTSAGVFGLFNAIDGYDFERGTKFETYCATRVRGAILDELRSQDWVPRMIRAKANRIHASYEELENKLQRDPTKEEMAAHLEVSVHDYEQMLKESSAATLVSLNKRVDESDGQSGSTQADILEDKRGPSPYDNLQMKDVIRLIHKNLTKQERLIVLLYYYEELTMKEIGAALDLSESRVCQILSKVTQRLKGRFKNMQNELLST